MSYLCAMVFCLSVITSIITPSFAISIFTEDGGNGDVVALHHQAEVFPVLPLDLSERQIGVVEEFAHVAIRIAHEEDVPPAVPLVLWYKENSLSRTAPGNCEGLMGLHTYYAVEGRCFPAGWTSVATVESQLRHGSRTFKRYCPEIDFHTADAALIQRCYMYYNKGPETTSTVRDSAYVVNKWDGNNGMWLYTVGGERLWITSLGAWPAHIQITQLMAKQIGQESQ